MDIALSAPAGASYTKGTDRVESSSHNQAAEEPNAAASSDEELITRVLWREELALSAIYDRYSRLVYVVALRIVGDRQAAEEVTQDVFQAVWQSAGSFRPSGNFSAWLIGIARHRAIDATRTRRYRSRAREEAFDDSRAAFSTGAAESQTDTILLQQAVRSAMAKLPQSQRQALELAYYGGLTYQEIAARLGEPIGTVKSRMRLGLTRLRGLLLEARD